MNLMTPFAFGILLLNSQVFAQRSSDLYGNEPVVEIMRSRDVFKIPNKSDVKYSTVKDRIPSYIYQIRDRQWLSNHIEFGEAIKSVDIDGLRGLVSDNHIDYMKKNGTRRTHHSSWMFVNCKDYETCMDNKESLAYADYLFYQKLNNECRFLNNRAMFYIKYFAAEKSPGGIGRVRVYKQLADEEGYAAVFGYATQIQYYVDTSYSIKLGLVNHPSYELEVDVSISGKSISKTSVNLKENMKQCL